MKRTAYDIHLEIKALRESAKHANTEEAIIGINGKIDFLHEEMEYIEDLEAGIPEAR